MSADLVSFVGVSRTYGSGIRAVVAVHAATCAVGPGDRIAVSGPSGSGKSTLLHLMAGLVAPTSGTLSWEGLGGNPRGRTDRVGVVFQGASLAPLLTIAENVALPLILRRDSVDPDRVSDALAATDIAGLATKLPDEISGGQAQRAAVARVLACRPQLILADEPTGRLDHETGRHVLDALVATADELGAAIVLATHDPRVAGLMEQCWTMRDGVLDCGGDRP